MMTRSLLVAMLIITCTVIPGLCLQQQTTTIPPGDVFGQSEDASLGWMNIGSTEHTGEYLAKTGSATGSASAYTSIDTRGNWTFELRSLDEKPVATIWLNLVQIGTIVFGAGTMGTDQIATANGAIVENTLTLNVVSYPSVNLFQMRLNIAGNATDGSFDYYSSTGGSVIQGKVSGEKDIPRTLS